MVAIQSISELMMERLKKPILSKLSSYATTPDGDDTMDECKKRSPHNLSNSGLGQQLAWGEHMGEQMMRNNAENNCSCFAGEDALTGYTVAQLLEWGRGVGASTAEFLYTIEMLSSDGHIYSTIDDQHFKATTPFSVAP